MDSGPSGLRRCVPRLSVENLPAEVVEGILSYLSYDEISTNRRVSRRFNSYCQRLLNQGFFRAERFHAKCLKAVKKQLPRRESERRTHPLARHCEILTSIETRLSLLSMTFMKYMDMGLCCFIPGKVIDEIFRVLRLVQKGGTPPRAHEILQELRDISSMAMEHFDERIAPELKLHMAPMKPPHLSFLASGQGALHQCPSGVEARTAELAAASSLLGRVQKPSIHAGVRSILNEEMKQLRTSNSLFRKTATECKAKGKLNEMNRKLLEQHREFSDVLEEVSRLREQVLASCATAAGAKGGGEAALAVVENAHGRPRRKRGYPALAKEATGGDATPYKSLAGDKSKRAAPDHPASEKRARKSPRTRSKVKLEASAGCLPRVWK
ncbi:F-box containing protein, putative [Ixodes scapularis]|uniref:F-box containing protein, putative n=1 Tax=Ixodes scapularis TaxID=6945 RepID=B7Q555_IXOSC|nr:F-box containing protein, putative [Ixodes scapularis]|eukprot:XP_002401494.1 F-box containing protein, putative [Ixodes scapularis]